MMGVLMSHREEIDNIRFVKFPTRPRMYRKVVRVEKIILASLNDREVACSRDMENWAYPNNLNAFPWMEEVIEGLFRLGMISAEAKAAHLERGRQNGEKQMRRYAAESLRRTAVTLGFELNEEQKRLVDEYDPLPAAAE